MPVLLLATLCSGDQKRRHDPERALGRNANSAILHNRGHAEKANSVTESTRGAVGVREVEYSWKDLSGHDWRSGEKPRPDVADATVLSSSWCTSSRTLAFAMTYD